MTKLFLCVLFLLSLVMPVDALEISAPEVPQSGELFMPDNTESFADGMMELSEKAIKQLRPDLVEASEVCYTVISAVMLISLLRTLPGNVKAVAEIAGVITIAAVLLMSTNSMLHLGAQTVQELSDYGKMLYPVMTAAMAAQGGMTSSAALYVGTSIFDIFLSSLISRIMIPMIYLFLALSTAGSAVGEELLKKISALIKNIITWCLKTILIVFTTYMSITGVVSGTTDAAALKATKVTISSVVPVVGSILSDASEAVLVSAGLMKNAAGIYGILAVLAVFLDPFLKIGSHYLMLKFTAAICGAFGTKNMTGLIDDFSCAMGLLLAMTGSVCLLLLISTICFMKGVG